MITFATDFGPSAPAVCRGVMFQIAPDANVIDINHQIPRFSIRDGAAVLVFALPHMPVGIHVAVVDPGVGTERRGIAIRVSRGDILIGPDNGLLVRAAERLGAVEEVRVLQNRDLMLPFVSSSFHGRDVFAPMAAHLAMGTPLRDVGPTIDPATLVRLTWPEPVVRAGELDSVITHVLIFGNVSIAGTPADLERAVGPLTAGRAIAIEFPASDGRASLRETTVWAETFGNVPVGDSLLMADSEGDLSFADNQGNAAERLGLAVDQPVRIRAG